SRPFFSITSLATNSPSLTHSRIYPLSNSCFPHHCAELRLSCHSSPLLYQLNAPMDLVKTLNTLRSYPEHEVSQRLRVDLLFSAVHFQVMKRHMLEPYSQDLQYRPRSSYMGICTSSARAHAHGQPECCFWYGMEGMGINFLVVMRPSTVLGSTKVTPEMIALTVGLHIEQRRRKQEDHIAYALATDGGVFRFCRMTKEGKSCETQCDSGNDYEDVMLLLMSIFDDALAPPGAKMISPTGHADPDHRRGNYPSTYEPDTDKVPEDEDYYKDITRMREMAVRVGVTVYMDVLQKLPNPLSPEAEKNTLKLLVVVINKATESPFNAIGKGDYEHRVADYGRSLMTTFDAKLKKVLEEPEFEDYNDNQKVSKSAIRKAVLGEIRPVFEVLLKDVRKKRLENMFK
ncbi:hypothetical protein N7463_007065, partial [Penicillium fimorum]